MPGRKPVGRRVQAVVDQLPDGRGRYMHAGIARGVIDADPSVGIGDPAVREKHVRHIARAFFAEGAEQHARGLGQGYPGAFELGHVEVEHIAQPRGAGSYAVCQVQPSPGCFDRMGAFAVFRLFDRMVVTPVDDRLARDLGVRDVVDERPADAAAVARVDKPVLRPGVEGIFPVHEFRV